MNGTQLKRQEYIIKRYNAGKDTTAKDIMRVFGVAKSAAYNDLKIFKNSVDKDL